jgi:hypothetical protein
MAKTNEDLVGLLLRPEYEHLLDILILAESGRGIEREAMARNTGKVLMSAITGTPMSPIDLQGVGALTEDQIRSYMQENTVLKQNIAKEKTDMMVTLQDQNKDIFEKQAELKNQFLDALKTALTQSASNERQGATNLSENDRAVRDDSLKALEERQKLNDTYSMSGATDAANTSFNNMRNELYDAFAADESINANTVMTILGSALSNQSADYSDEDAQRLLYNTNELLVTAGFPNGLQSLQDENSEFFGSMTPTLQAQINAIMPSVATRTQLDDNLIKVASDYIDPENMRGGVSSAGYIGRTVDAMKAAGILTIGDDGQIEFGSAMEVPYADLESMEARVNEYYVPAENQINANILALMSTGTGQKSYRDVMFNVVMDDPAYQEIAQEAAALPSIFGRRKAREEGAEIGTRRQAGARRAKNRVLGAARTIGKGKFEAEEGQSLTPQEAYALRQQARLKRRKGETLIKSPEQIEAEEAQKAALKEGALGGRGVPPSFAPAPKEPSKYSLGTTYEEDIAARKASRNQARAQYGKTILDVLEQAGSIGSNGVKTA